MDMFLSTNSMVIRDVRSVTYPFRILDSYIASVCDKTMPKRSYRGDEKPGILVVGRDF